MIYDKFNLHSNGNLIMLNAKSLRELVSEYLLNKLCDGDIDSGGKLNIAFLARELNVSATPMREALFGLSEKGVIDFTPNKGFSLKQLSFEEACEYYQIIGELDSLALRTSKPYSKTEITRLYKLIDKLEKDATRRAVSFATLSEFENAFVAKCPNVRLKNLCDEYRIYTFPYEQLVLKQITDLSNAFDTHREIIQLIEKEDFEQAASILEGTWQSCLPVLDSLLNSDT